jgi:hypothetical protein
MGPRRDAPNRGGIWLGLGENSMPLKTTASEGDDKPIRVFVSYEALRQLDPSSPPDLFAAMEIFDKHRAVIEKAASNKFDANGADEQYEGQAALKVVSMDLPI